MTPDIALVLGILAVAMVLLITEKIPMEVTALLALGTVALTGLVDPVEALAGFSNPAVVTVWAVFILSAGLQRTGVANIIGKQILRMAGTGETRIILTLMLSSGILSAIMNNVAVAALLLPVTMDIARQTRTSPSRLLMPLAFGCLLGGLTTMIGTPPNILASNGLLDAGLVPFGIFDFTPAGAAILVVGTLFTATVGRHLLPRRDLEKESLAREAVDLPEQYELRGRMFRMRLAAGSELVGKSLGESRLGSILGLNVLAITRGARMYLSPAPSEVLRADDRLLVEGRMEHVSNLSGWRELVAEEVPSGTEHLVTENIEAGEARVAHNQTLDGKTLLAVQFRTRFGLNVLAIRRGDTIRRAKLQNETIAAGDILLVQGTRDRLEAFGGSDECDSYTSVGTESLQNVYRLSERLFSVQVPPQSVLINRTLRECQLGSGLGLRVLAIERDLGTILMPEPEECLLAGDRLCVNGRPGDLEIARGLGGLEVESELAPGEAELESARIGLTEATLAPRSYLAGKTLEELHFREKFGLRVIAIWREGRVYRTELRNRALRFGDALLLFGPRERLRVLGKERDLVVLTEAGQDALPIEKAGYSVTVLALVLVPVLFGWVPIYIAAVIGAALMVLTKCLTMEDAYRAIEWKAIFLIAGMLPLGAALDQTGAARLIAEGVVGAMGGLGPIGVLAGLVLVTFLATFIVPTAALVVLMTPIILNTSANMGMSPHALMMAMALAASSSFTSPVAHPANLMVMGPGGYRFYDYVKAGIPLTVVVFAVILLLVPILWPLTP